MKKIIIFITLLFLTSIVSSSQNNAFQTQYENGIQFHDQGKYEKAIESYKKALKIEPTSILIFYEMAFSYFNKGDYENAVKYSNKVIKADKDHLLSAYIVNGSSLDMLGKTKESIKLFKRAIKKFDNYLLLYNLALNYYKLQDYKNAKKYVSEAIKLNSDHSSSHLILGYIENETYNKVPSLLSLYYFLFLEPNSSRSEEAYSILIDNFTRNVNKDTDKPNTINITLITDSKSEYSSAEFMLSLLTAGNMSDEDKNKTDGDKFIENTKSFFSILGEHQNIKSKNIAQNFYIPFFYKLAKSEHIDTFCYYISQVRSKESVLWLENNSEKIEKFATWLENN